jgi:hypothetical protein
MTDTTRLNSLTEPLIPLAMPAPTLMIPGGSEHPGVAHALLLALAFPLAWCLRDLIRRRRIDPFAMHECPVYCPPRRLAATQPARTTY